MGGKAHSGHPGAGMIFTQQGGDDLLLLEGYGDGGFRVEGRRFMGGVQVMATGIYPLNATRLDEIEASAMPELIAAAGEIEILLVGTGAKMEMLPAPVKAFLKERFGGFDAMDSGAAARTYNILAIEGRRVAAILLPV